MFLQKHPSEAANLNIDFTAMLGGHGQNETVALVPGGEDIQVDSNNYYEYIIRMADFHLNRSIRTHCLAFREGFTSVIDQTWIKLFDQREFNILVQGVKREIDIEDLEAHTHYLGATESVQHSDNPQNVADSRAVFGEQHVTIQAFWRVLKKFTPLEREKFLRFVTSHSRAPLRGFKDLEPHFSIMNTREGWPIYRSFTASLCSEADE